MLKFDTVLIEVLSFSRILVQPLQALSQQSVSWSPWEQSPLFLQQRQSLMSASSFLQRSTNSINNAKTTFQPIHPPSTTRPKSENASCSHSAKSPARLKRRIHNSLKMIMRGTEHQNITHGRKDLVDDYKYLSNSLNCLDIAKL